MKGNDTALAEGKDRTTREQTFQREDSTLEPQNRSRENETKTLGSNAHHRCLHGARTLFTVSRFWSTSVRVTKEGGKDDVPAFPHHCMGNCTTLTTELLVSEKTHQRPSQTKPRATSWQKPRVHGEGIVKKLHCCKKEKNMCLCFSTHRNIPGRTNRNRCHWLPGAGIWVAGSQGIKDFPFIL